MWKMISTIEEIKPLLANRIVYQDMRKEPRYEKRNQDIVALSSKHGQVRCGLSSHLYH